MSQTVLAVISSVFSAGIRIATSFKIPGTNTTPLQFIIFVLVALMLIKMVKRLANPHGADS